MQPGEWQSPLRAADIASAGKPANWPAIVGDEIWWMEIRPAEDGRRVIVSDQLGDILPAPFSASHRAHEYGGRSYLGVLEAGRPVLYFVNRADQRIYRMDRGAAPTPLTPETDSATRYAELRKVGDELWCVREVVDGHDCRRDLVAISATGEIRSLVAGHQFFAHPQVSPDGKHIAWVSWEHPAMPWDGTQLFVADVVNGELREPRPIAGGPTNPVLSPEWLDNETIAYLDESSGWWNPWTVSLAGVRTQLVSEESEWGFPAWQLGYQGISVLADGRLVGIHGPVDNRKFAVVDPRSKTVQDFATDYTFFAETFTTDGHRLVTVAASNSSFPSLVELDVANLGMKKVVWPNPLPVSADFAPPISEVRVPGNGREVKVILHRAHNPAYSHTGATPLLVYVHGGPTAHVSAVAQLDYLYWTSRGFTIADVNYGGSTGYGAAYRHLLDGQWGVVDYEDVISVVQALVAQGVADPGKVFISGGSAGGFTVLNALVHSNVFAAGADYFGVADLTMLAEDTHDFESRYLDSMIGPYPAAKHLYVDRSPLSHADRLSSPLIIFQGADDMVVPPSQSETFRDVCVAKGLKHRYFLFEGEGHGFVKAESIVTSLEQELLFFGEAGGFKPSL